MREPIQTPAGPLLRPPPLEAGDTLGVFTPSAPGHVRFREKYLHGTRQMEALGFRVKEGPLTARAASQGYRSGTPRERADELMALVLDDGVKGIVATIGGMNSSSLIPHLDFAAIRAHPKVICGYSDVTALHLAVLAFAGVSTFYGPAVMPSFGEWPAMLPETRESFLDAVQRHRAGPRELAPPTRWSAHFRDASTDAWRTVPRAFEAHAGWRVLRPGRASGPLIAANLNTLLAAAGTACFPELSGRVLMVEEMRAPWDVQERSFRHLQLLGAFERIAALVVGRPELPDAQGAPFGYDALLLEVLGEVEFPVVVDFDCGHTHPMLTLAQSTRVTVDADGPTARITLDEPMVAA